MKYLDLDNNPQNDSYDVYKNLKKMIKKFGYSFDILYKDIKIPIIINKFYTPLSSYSEDDSNYYYSIVLDENINCNYVWPSIQIIFDNNFSNYSYRTEDLNENNAEINTLSNICYNDLKMSGSEVVGFCIKLCKYLNVKTLFLIDAAVVLLQDEKKNTGKYIYLSDLKLLTHNITFYERFGFEKYFSNSDYINFIDLEDYKEKRLNVLDDFRSIKTDDIELVAKKYLKFINKFYIEILNEEKKIEIFLENGSIKKGNKYCKYHTKEEINDFLTTTKNLTEQIIYICNKYYEDYFYKIIINNAEKGKVKKNKYLSQFVTILCFEFLSFISCVKIRINDYEIFEWSSPQKNIIYSSAFFLRKLETTKINFYSYYYKNSHIYKYEITK